MAYGVKNPIYAITTLLVFCCVRAKVSLDLSIKFSESPPKEVVGHRNKPLVLDCLGYTSPEYGPLTVSWLYEGDLIEEGNGLKILQNGSLLIDKVQAQRKRSSKRGRGDGRYSCILRNRVGAILNEPTQVVIAHMSKNFTIFPEPLIVNEGAPARFQCQIFSVPAAVITWYRNNLALPPSNKWYETLPSGVLQIQNVSNMHEGLYHCVASNGYRKRESPKVSLSVTDAFKTFSPPSFLSIPSQQIAVENDTIILECLVKGTPLLNISWKKKGKDGIESAIDLTMVKISGQRNLVIAAATLSDEGEYICIASVTDPNTGLYYEVTQESSLVVHSPPIFETQPISQLKPTAKTTRFECSATGVPTPSYRWYKNGEPLYINGRIKLLAGNILIISQTIITDSGIYQCFSNNSAGMISTAARLQVNASNNQPQPPGGLVAKTYSNDSILLSWEPSLSPDGFNIQAYTVHYLLTAGGLEKEAVAVNTSQLVEKLTPFTNYSFYVRAYTYESASEQSEIVTQVTGEDIPIAAPSVMLESLSPTTIKVSWTMLPPDKARGVVSKYRIYYRKHNQLSHSVIEVSGHVMEYTITARSPKRKYDIRVLGGTSVGFPHLSDDHWKWETIETPGLPLAKLPTPPVLHLTVVNSSTIEAKWHMDSGKDLPAIKGYKLSYRKQGHQLKGPFQVPANVTTFLLSELALQTWYEVYLVAYNRDGDGEETFRTISTLSEGYSPDLENFEILEPPFQLEAEPLSFNTVHLQWKMLVTTKNITYYTIKYRAVYVVDSENSTNIKHIQSTNSEVTVTDLNPFTLYEFSVRANDVNNQLSRFSVKTECMTLEDVPGVPRDVSFTPLGATSVRLSWSPPLVTNGAIIAYHVTYKVFNSHPEKEKLHINSGSGLSTVLTNLASNTLYTVVIKAETKAGLGPPSPYISLNIPVRTNVTRPASEALESETNDPSLGIILGISIGGLFIIICAFIIVFRNRLPSRCYSFPNAEGNSYCCCGKIEQIPCQNGTVYMERGQKRSDGTELQEMTPMLTQIPIDNHLDTKGGYPLTNGHANGFHYQPGDQSCKPYANGIETKRANPLDTNNGSVVAENGLLEQKQMIDSYKNQSDRMITNESLENGSSAIRLNGSALKDRSETTERVPFLSVDTSADFVVDSKDAVNETPNDPKLILPPFGVSSRGSMDNLRHQGHGKGQNTKLPRSDNHAVLNLSTDLPEGEREPSFIDSPAESDEEEANASMKLLLPPKLSSHPVTDTAINIATPM